MIGPISSIRLCSHIGSPYLSSHGGVVPSVALDVGWRVWRQSQPAETLLSLANPDSQRTRRVWRSGLVAAQIRCETS